MNDYYAYHLHMQRQREMLRQAERLALPEDPRPRRVVRFAGFRLPRLNLRRRATTENTLWTECCP